MNRILHINTFSLLQSTAAAGQWIWFALLMVSQPLYYATVLTHVAVSLTRGFITLGWLTSDRKRKRMDLVVYILCAAAFAAATFVVLRTELLMFLPGGETV